MFCSQCGSKCDGPFCSNCGAKVININENKASISKQSGGYIENTPINIPVKKGIFYYIKMFFWWYLCASFIVSGIAVLGIRAISGITWFIGGIIICPALLKDYSAGIRFLISIILFAIGAVCMP